MHQCGGKEEDSETPLGGGVIPKIGGRGGFGELLGNGGGAELRILERIEGRGWTCDSETGEGAETGDRDRILGRSAWQICCCCLSQYVSNGCYVGWKDNDRGNRQHFVLQSSHGAQFQGCSLTSAIS